MYADQFFKPLGGTSPLVCANQKDRPELFSQRYMRWMKYRADRNHCLMTTVFALKNLALFYKIGFIMAALGTQVSFRPSKLSL
jgi:hypothetical protein